LVLMYGRCKSVEEACEVFNGITQPDLFSDFKCWNATIAALSQNGCSKKAVELYKLFQLEGLEPSEITVLSVLSACSRAGLLAEGHECFKSIQADDRLKKLMSPEHYACMVDLLSRTGNLSEARAFIESMPLAASSSVWNSLLGACGTQSEKLLGITAAQQAME
ncbi:hypothetical protein SELMODRAFT_72200, partial [Selaginella moellendorffii]